MSDGKILVLGGTGAIGKYLCESLIRRGYEVFVTSRREHIGKGKLHYICGNAKNIKFLNEIFSLYNFDVIFDFMIYNESQFKERYNILLDNCKQYFFSSSQRVYADSDDDGWLRENSKRKVDCISENSEWEKDIYGCTKGREENILFSSKKKNWTIVRMSMTFSNSRFQFGPLDNFDVVRAMRGQCSALPDTLIDKETTLTYGKVTAELLSSLVLRDGALANVFNVGSRYSYTWREIAGIYHKVFGLTYKSIQEDKYIFATNTKKIMVDRRLNRKLDCSKIYYFNDNSRIRFELLEDGLTDAWNEADHKKYINGVGNLDAHTLIDIYTNSVTNQSALNPTIRKKYNVMYKRMKNLVEKNIYNNNIFCVTDNSHYWNIEKEEEKILISRSKNILEESHNRWCSFMPNFELKNNKKYLFKMEFNSSCDTKMLIFSHGYAYNSEKILRYPVNVGKNIISFSFKLNRTARFLAITATDFAPEENIEIQNIELIEM